jgi:hypothetical protein
MRMRKLIIALLILMLVSVSMPARAEGEFTISSYTVDAGGGYSTGGDFVLRGTIGQPEAGTSSSGDLYTLSGGFWHANLTPPPFNAPSSDQTYLPLIQR